MEVLEQITNIISNLNELEEYDSNLQEQLSNQNKKLLDLEHYIENNKLDTKECYRIVKEFRNVRKERRKIKNDIELISTYNIYKNRLISPNNRQFLLAEINKVNKYLNKGYTNRIYTEEELNEILGKGVANV